MVSYAVMPQYMPNTSDTVLLKACYSPFSRVNRPWRALNNVIAVLHLHTCIALHCLVFPFVHTVQCIRECILSSDFHMRCPSCHSIRFTSHQRFRNDSKALCSLLPSTDSRHSFASFWYKVINENYRVLKSSMQRSRPRWLVHKQEMRLCSLRKVVFDVALQGMPFHHCKRAELHCRQCDLDYPPEYTNGHIFHQSSSLRQERHGPIKPACSCYWRLSRLLSGPFP